MYTLIGQFFRFASVGVIGTLVHFITLYLLVELAGASPLAGSGLGFVVGALANYVLNYYFTFRSDKRHNDALIKFFAVALTGLVINLLVIRVLTVLYVTHFIIAQIYATGLVLVWNFIGNRCWTFREGHHANR